MFGDLNPDAPDSSGMREDDGEAAVPTDENGDGVTDDAELADWKDALRKDFEEWLAGVDSIPESEDENDEWEVPDLYSFYEQLALISAEHRKGNRRTAEVFSQWGDVLSRFENELRPLREELARFSAAQPAAPPLSRADCLHLVEILDRMRRLAEAFRRPPPSSWWPAVRPWRDAWETQRQAMDIVTGQMEELLRKAGVFRVETIGHPFDPAAMMAVEVEANLQQPHQTVIGESAAGYRRHGEILRVAQVKISIHPSPP